jgi:hypothetical protein
MSSDEALDQNGDWMALLVAKQLLDSGVDLESEEGDALFLQVFKRNVEKGGQKLLRELRRTAKPMLDEHARLRSKFEKRLYRVWRTPLQQFEILLVCAAEIGEEFNTAERARAVQDQDFSFEALIRLHARACQLGGEILCLLKAGFAAGAYARWRTLHEVAVVALLISEHGNELAERYLKHEAIETRKLLLQYQEHHARLGYASPSADEIEEISTLRDRLLVDFGPEFGEEYGWAFPVTQNKKANFSHLEAKVGLGHYRALVKSSCGAVHAGTRGITHNPGVPVGTEVMLAGTSNTGLAEPGHSAALSLLQATVALLSNAPNTERLIAQHALIRLVSDMGDSFARAHLRTMERVFAHTEG